MKFSEKIEEIKKIIGKINNDDDIRVIEEPLKSKNAFGPLPCIVTDGEKLISINKYFLDIEVVHTLIEFELTEFITHISFDFNNDSLESLKNFPSLTSLVVFIDESFDFDHVSHLKLSELTLHKKPEIDTSRAFTASMMTLESIYLYTNIISDDDALIVNKSPNLTKFTTFANNIEKLTSNSITHLEVGNEIDLLSTKNLSSLITLETSLSSKSNPLPNISSLKKVIIKDSFENSEKIIDLDLFSDSSVEVIIVDTYNKVFFSKVNYCLLNIEIKGNYRSSDYLDSSIYDSLSSIRNHKKYDIDLNCLLGVYPKLNVLYISDYNVIGTDILSCNDNLTKLSLHYCGLVDVGFLNKFSNLLELSLPGNFISSVPHVENIENMKLLNLYNNEIVNVPKTFNSYFVVEEYCSLPPDSRGVLAVGVNPVISPSMDIIRRGKAAVDSYYSSMQGDIAELNEAKIIFLGPGSVGKTSLMKCLSGLPFDPQEETTHGINIQKYNVDVEDGSKVNAKIWDFGGQQINHTTHQLFLSQRCVYVLVVNDRNSDEAQDPKVDYWLQQVKAFGGDSKVIIVRNKCDDYSHSNLSEGLLRSKFPNITDIVAVSCKKDKNIDGLRRIINREVSALPMRKMLIPSNWKAVKDEVQGLSEELDHFSLSKFSEICFRHDIIDENAQKTLLDLLNDLSLIIVFPELAAYDMGVLNPHWITDGLYSIINLKEFKELNNSTARKQKGLITQKQVQEVLDRLYPGRYANKAKFIIDSLLKFELCHSIGGDNSGKYLVPSLLPEPDHKVEIERHETTIDMVFNYKNLLPKAIFTKFLVRMNKDISADNRWKSAAILSDSAFNAKALVIEDDVSKTITVKVVGEQARDYFATIRKTINDLNEPDAIKLGVEELVIIPNSGGNTVPYKALLVHESAGEPYFCIHSREKYSASALLSGIETRQYTAARLEKMEQDESHGSPTVNINIENNSNAVTTTTTSQEQNQRSTQSQTVSVSLELKLFKGAADNVIDDLKDELEDEINDEKALRKATRDCDKALAAIEDIQSVETEEQALEKASSFDRVHRFLSGAIEGSSKVGESMTALRETTGQVKELAKKYNSIASCFGLPVVPEFLL
ncbi:COR domain-containing protein [Vibrio europaeus]|uniref:COR domain-containing protein n=1 Tax=Vibrio europaeus TaxID=300876 RepID=UPI0039E0E3B7